MVILLAVYGREVYGFKLLFELTLNSGCDYLSSGLVHHREEDLLTITRIDLFHHGYLYFPDSTAWFQASFHH